MYWLHNVPLVRFLLRSAPSSSILDVSDDGIQISDIDVRAPHCNGIELYATFGRNYFADHPSQGNISERGGNGVFNITTPDVYEAEFALKELYNAKKDDFFTAMAPYKPYFLHVGSNLVVGT